jgi:hypothetical protein
MCSPNTSSTAKHEDDKFMHSRLFFKVVSPLKKHTLSD